MWVILSNTDLTVIQQVNIHTIMPCFNSNILSVQTSFLAITSSLTTQLCVTCNLRVWLVAIRCIQHVIKARHGSLASVPSRLLASVLQEKVADDHGKEYGNHVLMMIAAITPPDKPVKLVIEIINGEEANDFYLEIIDVRILFTFNIVSPLSNENRRSHKQR